jgi:hypothetical protein
VKNAWYQKKGQWNLIIFPVEVALMEIDYSSLDFDEKEMSIWDYATQVQGIVEPRNRGWGRKMRQKEKEKKIVQMRNRIRVKRMNKWPILTWSNN